MLLKQLLASLRILSIKDPQGTLAQLNVNHLCFDSREVTEESLFFALPGLHHDGAAFAQEAVNRGAVAVVTQQEDLTLTVPIIRVAHARKAMAVVAATFYEDPSTRLSLCGVTGTNGKTTTTYLVRHLCDAVGRACGLIGTVECIFPGRREEAFRTTPESIPIQQMLAEMRDGGFKAVAMEVASHAIVQQRVDGIEFDVAVFTNLTQDHLDYHGTMEAYFEAKAYLFEMLACQEKKKGRAVINVDDRYGRQLIDRFSSRLKVTTFGQSNHADFRASAIHFSPTGTTFCLTARGRDYLVRSPFIGLFNVYNVLGALAAAASMGLELRRVIKALESAPQVPGRLQRLSGKRNFQVFVDYAHTPDALENVLSSLKQLNPERLVVLFGCGGDRDRAKRPLMAAAVEQYADQIIVTTDNPRNEDPQAIIAEVEQGFRHKRYRSIVDREEAIRSAVKEALPGDFIVIAGKGHETYQEVAGLCLPFDDVQVAQRAMKEMVLNF
ncbi:MAG: UDP-N-acetylmuramoyl-L-alanyl-D-glutamate--2,6-diaminopimelate ligase [Chthoniobacterales bacterium]|nr:UDP-N-acetylmuramoyl-L-alanyl-D-glutamate--2,6-diaminopimelate ligase [Chthoniobacterales bacterium]